MGFVTESLENHDTTVHSVERNRLYRALAWVGIVAGSLFIVGSVFFTGYVLGQNSGGHNGGGGHHGPHAMMLRPFHGPDGPMGPDDSPRSARLTPPEQPTPPAKTSTPARP